MAGVNKRAAPAPRLAYSGRGTDLKGQHGTAVGNLWLGRRSSNPRSFHGRLHGLAEDWQGVPDCKSPGLLRLRYQWRLPWSMAIRSDERRLVPDFRCGTPSFARGTRAIGRRY